MDEQRTQAYLNLINEILTCPSGKEVARLNAHSELLDAGFAEVLQGWAEDTLAKVEDGTLAQILPKI